MKFSIKLLIGVCLILFLIHRADMHKVFLQIRNISIWTLFIAFVVKISSIVAQINRWHLLLKSQGVAIGSWMTIKLTLLSRFINLFSPGQIGGDIYRVYGAKEYTASILQSTGIVILERYLGFLVTLILGTIAIITGDFMVYYTNLSLLVMGLLIVCLLVIVFATNRHCIVLGSKILGRSRGFLILEEYLLSISSALKDFLYAPWVVVRLLLLSLIMKITTILQIYLLGCGMGLDLKLLQLIIFLPLFDLASSLPISINGLGIREASLVVFFSQMGLPADGVTGLAFLLLIWIYITDLPYGIIFLLGHKNRERRVLENT